MYSKLATVGITIALLTVTIPALAQEPSPRNPVVNGEFELDSPVGNVLADTPADECIGIGHQVLFGSQSPQGKIAGGSYDDPDPAQSDPQGAAEDVANDPEGEALFASGYGHCVWGEDTGYDLCWCNPASLASDEAIHWSGHDDDTVDNFDGDEDREIKITKDSGHHNLWQAFPSPHQAYTGNFDALELRVEDGQIANSARVVVTFSATPLQAQSPWVGYFGDCSLSFSADQFTAGPNSIDPVDASFSSKSADCEDAKDEWDNGDDADKRDVLGRLRIVQLSFWGWDNVDTPDDEVVLDGISLAGASLAAEEAATGNVNPNPTDETDAPE